MPYPQCKDCYGCWGPANCACPCHDEIGVILTTDENRRIVGATDERYEWKEGMRDALALHSKALVANEALRAERDALAARVDAAKALHNERGAKFGTMCSECEAPFPCPTLRALEGSEG